MVGDEADNRQAHHRDVELDFVVVVHELLLCGALEERLWVTLLKNLFVRARLWLKGGG